MTDPPRLLDDPATGDALRSALEAGRAEVPTEAQLDALAAKLGPLIGGGPGGGPPAGPSPVAGAAATGGKLLGGLGIAAAGVAVALLVATPDDPVPPRPRPAPVAEAPVEAPASSLPEGLDVPEDAVPEDVAPPPEPSIARPRASPRPAPAFEVDPAAELALLRRSQDALRSDPAAALALTAEHERRFGLGTLGQEREVVAIDALDRLGRDDAARARAASFRERWPRSAHLRRIEVILE